MLDSENVARERQECEVHETSIGYRLRAILLMRCFQLFFFQWAHFFFSFLNNTPKCEPKYPLHHKRALCHGIVSVFKVKRRKSKDLRLPHLQSHTSSIEAPDLRKVQVFELYIDLRALPCLRLIFRIYLWHVIRRPIISPGCNFFRRASTQESRIHFRKYVICCICRNIIGRSSKP